MSGYTEKTVKITCCAEVYERWQKEQRFSNHPSPLGPRDFTVNYAETGPKDGPVAVVIHGAPGSYKEYAGIMTCLTSRGIRAIVPNFPKCPEYLPPYFRHTTEEKTAFFKAFLEAIGVSDIDCLIAHSSGVYTAINFCIESKHDVRSIAFFNPTGFELVKSVEPWWLIRSLNYACEYQWSYSLVHTLGNLIISLAKSALNPEVDNHSHLLSVITMVNSRFLEAEPMYDKLAKHPRPALLVWADHDRLIQVEVFQRVAAKLAGKDEPDSYWHYTRDGKLSHEGSKDGKIKALVFDSKAHFLFNYHKDLYAKEIEELIQRARQK